MAFKRPRREFESDFKSQENPFVTYGTPLPAYDHETRDDGSFVPVWKQEVTDERGRKRLHGAFTGGFSAGYFNTVGSKEGWTPSTFVSSRTNRRKDDSKASLQRAEDFMDEEDLAQVAEGQALQTSQAFSGLGGTGDDEKRRGFMMDLFKTEGDTMGTKLMRKMGWRDGQGIGPRVRRKVQLDDDQDGLQDQQEQHLLAPVNSSMIVFVQKKDRKGLGFAGEGRLALAETAQSPGAQCDEYENDSAFGSGKPTSKIIGQRKPLRSGIGVGVLNDLGSDDDDPYEMGPRISYNKVIGGDKKKTKAKLQKPKTASQAANPLLTAKPIFMSKKAMPAGFRKCHDGRLPLAGFLLFDASEPSTSLADECRWPRPRVPEGWVSSKKATTSPSEEANYQSNADVAKLSKLDPKSRAAMLGEAPLPGKSIFDFLSPAARDRLASATGKMNLPAALNEAPPISIASAFTPFNNLQSASSRVLSSSNLEIPTLDKATALAGLGRGIGGWMPYAEDPLKSSRYRAFLEFRGEVRPSLPPDHRPTDMAPEAWIQELREFAHAAQVFKPMTGMMASRFTTSTATAIPSSTGEIQGATSLISQSTPAAAKPDDPAEAAARMCMFGPMTRSVLTFAPTRLVCKRFGVKPPAHIQTDAAGASDAVPTSSFHEERRRPSGAPGHLVSKAVMEAMVREAGVQAFTKSSPVVGDVSEVVNVGSEVGNGGNHVDGKNEDRVDIERNEALEGKRAGEAVFKAIFGSDDEDDE